MELLLRNLRIRTTLGVYEWEQKAPREVLLHLAIAFDATAAMASDQLEDTIDYDALEREMTTHFAPLRFQLIEAVAATAAKLVLENPRVSSVMVEVEKPGALRHTDIVVFRHTFTR